MSLRILNRIAAELQEKARALQASADDLGSTVHGSALERARERRALALALLFTAEAIAVAIKEEGGG